MKFNLSLLGFCFAAVLTACGGGDPYDAGAQKVKLVALASNFVGSSYGYSDGTGNAVKFSNPVAVALASNGDLYVGDSNRIRKVTSAGLVSTFATLDASVGLSGIGIQGIAIDANSNIYVSSYSGQIIKISNATTPVVTVFAGGTGGGFDDHDTGTSATFRIPKGLAFDQSGNLYVADSGNHAIRKILPSGAVSTVAGTGIAGDVDGPALNATFKFPAGVIVDANGNLYVADTYNHVIRKIATNGWVTTVAGSGVAGYANGTGAAASFNTPQGITIDKKGNLIVTDTGNYSIRTVTPQGVVTTLAGDGETPGSKNGLDWQAQFSSPIGITVGPDGNFYVADSQNYVIRLLKMVWI